MNEAPRVSVVVPSYNSGRFIEATIASILGQSFTGFELVVADHSSTDGTWEALQRHGDDPRVRLVRTPPGGGAAANWARATAEASGEYLKLVPGDDLLAPTCLARQVAVLDAHPGVVLVAAQRSVIDERGDVLVRARGLAGLRGLTPGRDAVRRAVLAGTNLFGEPGCVLLRRAALVDAGGWDATDPFVIDQATYSNVLLRGDFFGIAEPLASFRVASSQWSQRLVGEQARQVMAFHHRLAEAHEGLLTPQDLRRGDRAAQRTAAVRRATYAGLALRERGRTLTRRAAP